jgi:hypothetical protein
MGITYTSVEIENLFNKRRMSIRALVDSGAVFMTIPKHVALQLGYDLEELGFGLFKPLLRVDPARRPSPGGIFPSGRRQSRS